MVAHLPRLFGWERRTAAADRQTAKIYVLISNNVYVTKLVCAMQLSNCCHSSHNQCKLCQLLVIAFHFTNAMDTVAINA